MTPHNIHTHAGAPRARSALHDLDALQARLATRLTAALTAQPLPHDIAERLRTARESAVARARAARRAHAVAPTSVIGGGRGGAAVLGGGPAWWQRMASVLPLVVLAAGLVLIGQWSAREQVLAAADIDAVLLADDLPPAAYADPGFAEFLKSPAP